MGSDPHPHYSLFTVHCSLMPYLRDKRSPTPKSPTVSHVMSRNRAKDTNPNPSSAFHASIDSCLHPVRYSHNPMQRYFYSNSIADFISESSHSILGKLTESSPFAVDQHEKDAWLEEIRILKDSLTTQAGKI